MKFRLKAKFRLHTATQKLITCTSSKVFLSRYNPWRRVFHLETSSSRLTCFPLVTMEASCLIQSISLTLTVIQENNHTHFVYNNITTSKSIEASITSNRSKRKKSYEPLDLLLLEEGFLGGREEISSIEELWFCIFRGDRVKQGRALES